MLVQYCWNKNTTLRTM